MTELLLTGLDGSNPLGFLAGLGVLEAMTARRLPAKLSWRNAGGWRAVALGAVSMDDLLALLDEDRVACSSEPALALEYEGKRDLKPSPSFFADYLRSLVRSSGPLSRRGVDWAASFGSDVVQDNNGNTKPTALHFAAGQQQFLKMVEELTAGTTRDDLREALVGPWTYSRELPVLGWDATANRDWALRASNPSKDRKTGVPGADWLAFRGLASLPVAPTGSSLHTTGCDGRWKTGRFRWGLWTIACDLDVARSALRLPLAEMPVLARLARGIDVVFQCGIRRSAQGGYGSFEPAQVV